MVIVFREFGNTISSHDESESSAEPISVSKRKTDDFKREIISASFEGCLVSNSKNEERGQVTNPQEKQIDPSLIIGVMNWKERLSLMFKRPKGNWTNKFRLSFKTCKLLGKQKPLNLSQNYVICHFRLRYKRNIDLLGTLYVTNLMIGFFSFFNETTIFGHETAVGFFWEDIQDITMINQPIGALMTFVLSNGIECTFVSVLNINPCYSFIKAKWQEFRKSGTLTESPQKSQTKDAKAGAIITAATNVDESKDGDESKNPESLKFGNYQKPEDVIFDSSLVEDKDCFTIKVPLGRWKTDLKTMITLTQLDSAPTSIAVTHCEAQDLYGITFSNWLPSDLSFFDKTVRTRLVEFHKKLPSNRFYKMMGLPDTIHLKISNEMNVASNKYIYIDACSKMLDSILSNTFEAHSRWHYTESPEGFVQLDVQMGLKLPPMMPFKSFIRRDVENEFVESLNLLATIMSDRFKSNDIQLAAFGLVDNKSNDSAESVPRLNRKQSIKKPKKEEDDLFNIEYNFCVTIPCSELSKRGITPFSASVLICLFICICFFTHFNFFTRYQR